MIMAAHQPQYIPYLGYFHKIAACDLFVWLDDVQYKKREFQNRNRILTARGELWLTVPVITKGNRFQTIADVEIDDSGSWRASHWASIKQNYSKAPQFKRHEEFFSGVYGKPWGTLEALSREIVNYLCTEFGIAVPFRKASEFAVKTTSTARLVDLCRAVGAGEYLSGAGGRAYLQEDLFNEAGLKLSYQSFEHPRYRQCFPGFSPNLSALDFLFNEDAGSAKSFFSQGRA